MKRKEAEKKIILLTRDDKTSLNMAPPLRYVAFGLCRRCFLSQHFCQIFFGVSFLVAIMVFVNVGFQLIQIESLLTRTGFFNEASEAKVATTTLKTNIYLTPERMKQVMINKKNNNLPSNKIQRSEEMKKTIWMEKIEKLNKLRAKPVIRHVELEESVDINYDVHVFYYAWYENEAVDGNWQHWNHLYLKNWRKDDFRIYPTGRHLPPDDIGSNFYPLLGCYSSKDPIIVDIHMKQMRDAGIGVLIVSWYPPGMSDGSTHSPDAIFKQLLDIAKKHDLKIAPHVEPYKDRNPMNFAKYLKYFVGAYGNHPALYKMKKGRNELIVYYIYDSYRTPALSWRQIMDVNGNQSLRGTELDGIFLGLLVDADHKNEIRRARFDGFYTYFASNGFTFGSSWKNWRSLSNFARIQNLIFIPSVGPGYVDTRVRPWNSANTRHRRNGKYYEVGWRTAISAGVNYVSITSFNEWHEGTQIEPAVPKKILNFTYFDYEPEGPEFYLNLTKFWINEFSKKSSASAPIL